VSGNSLILLRAAVNALQHEIYRQNEAKTVKNPYKSTLKSGDPSRIRTCNPRRRNPLLVQVSHSHRKANGFVCTAGHRLTTETP
jgi:hypothetical protein